MLAALSPRSAYIVRIGLLAATAVLLALVLPASAQRLPTYSPAQPQGLTGDVSHDSASLRWDDSNDGSITGYQVLRRNRETDLSGVFSVRVDDTGSAGYSYFNAAAPSAPAEGSTPLPPLGGPRTEQTASMVEQSDARDGGICDRTEAVRVGLVDLIDDLYPAVASCADVTDAHLAAITGSLDLRHSGIDSLKVGDFASLTRLETLKLARNRLRTLPAGVFAGLGSLKDLDLWQNELQTLPAGVFSGLTSLQDLDLEENELHVLPAGVFDGLSLRFLGLEGNRLRTLPPGLFADVDVTLTLDLSDNELRALPEDVFSGLTDLNLLDLAENQLRVLPAGVFSGLTGLTTLWVDKNPGAPFTFTMMPKQIPGTNKMVVTVVQGAPFPMTTTIGVTGGTPPVSVFPVTVATGRTTSDEIDMTSLGGATATMGTSPPVPESNAQGTFHGIETAVGGPVTFYDTSAGAGAITSNPGPDETYAAGDAIEVTVTFAESMTVDTTDGIPQIGLTIGTMPKLAGYASGSGTAALVFSYTVAEGDLDTDGVSIGAGSIRGHRVDGVKPLLLSAMVDDAVMTLTYSRVLRESPAPLASAFTVAGGATARTVSNVAVTGNVVDLALNPAVEQSETGLTVSYTAPTGTDTGGIQDLVGNEADGLSSEPVWSDAPDTTDPVANREPEFPSSETSWTIHEMPGPSPYPIGLSIGRVEATDPDSGDTLSYSLGGDGAASFDIVASTGWVLNEAVLDYEVKTRYTIIVSVHDGKDADGYFSEAIDDMITVTINLLNEEEAGTVALSLAQLYVGAALTATLTDPDGSISNITWQWASSPNGSSNWAPISGAASARYMPVDGDAGNYLRATASYTDGHGAGKNAQAVSANPVEDAPSPPPPPPPPRTGGGGGGGGGGAPANRAPEFMEGDRTTRSIAENTPAGVNIGDPVAATDFNRDTLTYSLRGLGSDLFDVDASSGQLLTKAILDYETESSYIVFVWVQDNKNAIGRPDTERDTVIRIELAVTNEDEAGAVALSLSEPDVDVLLTAALIDPDGGLDRVVWSWARSADQTAWTAIRGAALASYTPVAADKGSYLRGTASYTDAHGPRKSAQAVTAAPVPSNAAPEFTDAQSGAIERSVAENTNAGEAVGAPVAATDAEDDAVTYALGGADAALFTIDETTGQIRVGAGTTLDHEADKNVYEVVVTATDSLGLSATVAVTIAVTNVGVGSPLADAYDADGNEAVDRDEILAAVADYFAGAITKEEAVAVIRLYFAS